MGTGKRVRIFTGSLRVVLLLSSSVLFFAVYSAAGSTLEIAKPTSLQLSPSILVDKSPGSRPGVSVLCERVHIHGLSRIKHLRKMAYSVKVKVFSQSGSHQPTKFEVCFHR
ncbi:hypothetical protein CDL15_Pgr017183 [Punica granatum]|nr:hypothetical protein CDL15_Pgr017183 [Punica granatum]